MVGLVKLTKDLIEGVIFKNFNMSDFSIFHPDLIAGQFWIQVFGVHLKSKFCTLLADYIVFIPLLAVSGRNPKSLND